MRQAPSSFRRQHTRTYTSYRVMCAATASTLTMQSAVVSTTQGRQQTVEPLPRPSAFAFTCKQLLRWSRVKASSHALVLQCERVDV